MTYLPVRAIRVGDTGTVSDDKQAKFTLGPLVCTGDGESGQPKLKYFSKNHNSG